MDILNKGKRVLFFLHTFLTTYEFFRVSLGAIRIRTSGTITINRRHGQSLVCYCPRSRDSAQS
ncbi:hypothetical protein CCACVL1_01427, partial [Corchorus capsularis]